MAGPQNEPAPWNVPFNIAHCADDVMMHMWFGRQQPPICGCAQFAVAHVVPSPEYVPPSCAHCADVLVWQPPLGRQHAPTTGAGHAVGEHVVPSP